MGKKGNGDWFTEPVEKIEVRTTCPQCSSAMTPQAVLCMICGYNLQTGEYVDLPGKPASSKKRRKKKSKVIRNIFFCLLLLCAGTAVYGYLCYESFLLRYREYLPRTYAYQLPEHLDRPFFPKWLRDFKYKSINRTFNGIVSEEMDQKAPMYRVNEEVDLELIAGQTQQGVYKGSTEQHLLLEIPDGIFEIPFTTLKTGCRVRCDTKERTSIIHKVAHDRALTFLMGDQPRREQEHQSYIKKASETPILGKQHGGSSNKGCSD